MMMNYLRKKNCVFFCCCDIFGYHKTLNKLKKYEPKEDAETHCYY